ncbi:hypothetical protein HanOQP8_Chr10g0361361 [Helianthus annuus]|nr:hypothetical protein HanOQP8_Chr10g0361361 [Helianthus annuus]KAJ0883346.1 hypothetical protein HanPSC8_Chr10g0420441 [Helianthus annuus]
MRQLASIGFKNFIAIKWTPHDPGDEYCDVGSGNDGRRIRVSPRVSTGRRVVVKKWPHGDADAFFEWC